MEEMYLDDTVMLEEMPANVADRPLMATMPEKRKQIKSAFAVSGRQCRKYHERRLYCTITGYDGRRCDPKNPSRGGTEP